MFKTLLTASALTLAASVAFADGIRVEDPYARSSAMSATSGAAFMVLHNDTDMNDTLVEARADGVAERIELHTHIADENGVMRMREVEGGIPVEAHGMTSLARGGLHVMFLGLADPFEQGEEIDLTLVFEHAGEVSVTVPVDLERKPDHGAMQHDMSHEGMSHDSMEGHSNMEGHDDHGNMTHSN